jgi:ribosomal protein L16 Arg81 hydroxylase
MPATLTEPMLRTPTAPTTPEAGIPSEAGDAAPAASPERSAGLTFRETLGDLDVDDFLSRIWGRSFVHLRGSRGRFHPLLSWREVNGMLQKHRLEPPRLRLARNGAFAPKNSYLRYEGAGVPFVVPERLSELLRDGYTLIVDAVDDMIDGVMHLAEDFERVLHESVQVNMYAGWREQQGFNRHCDTHDVVVLQLFGRKYWRVYEGGRPHPLKNDIAPNSEPPQKLAWEGMLEDGDVLYLPRGWWHEASGVGELTLHLTFGIHQRTGVNLMHWLADELRATEAFRAGLRRFGTEEERRAQLEEIRAQLLAELDDRLLERYFATHDRHARSRGWANLPWSAVPSEPPPPSTLVRLDTPRRLEIARAGGSIAFEANGRAWKLGSSAEPLLKLLEEGPATIASLCASSAGALEPATVQQLIVELAREGLVRLEGEPAS